LFHHPKSPCIPLYERGKLSADIQGCHCERTQCARQSYPFVIPAQAGIQFHFHCEVRSDTAIFPLHTPLNTTIDTFTGIMLKPFIPSESQAVPP